MSSRYGEVLPAPRKVKQKTEDKKPEDADDTTMMDASTTTTPTTPALVEDEPTLTLNLYEILNYAVSTQKLSAEDADGRRRYGTWHQHVARIQGPADIVEIGLSHLESAFQWAFGDLRTKEWGFVCSGRRRTSPCLVIAV